MVKKVQDLSNIPTIGHLEGICHSYVDKDANPKIAKNVIYNAKLRNTAICGATETILLHEKIIKKFKIYDSHTKNSRLYLPYQMIENSFVWLHGPIKTMLKLAYVCCQFSSKRRF